MGNGNKIKEKFKGSIFYTELFLLVLLTNVTVGSYFESLNFCGFISFKCGKIYSRQGLS